MGSRRVPRAVAVIALSMLALVGPTACGGGSGDGDDDTTDTTFPPDAVEGLDDFDGNGDPDPTCGTQDFGADLVLRIPCFNEVQNEPPDGVTLTDTSLFRLPGATDLDLTGISGSVIRSRTADGKKVSIVTNNSDALFETNRDVLPDTATLDNTIALINAKWPFRHVQVRGHTDGTEPNETLSERRADNVKAYLESHGLKAETLTAVGLGHTQPFAVEDNDDARAFNRRVEIVVRDP